LDLRLGGIDGLTVLKELKSRDPALPVIMMTALNDVAPGVEAMKAGAYDYVKKPFDPDDLVRLTGNALRASAWRRELKRVNAGHARRYQYLLSVSPAMREVQAMVAFVSGSPATPVLLVGETGTGKEVVARAIHGASLRGDQHFVAVNCSALGENLLEAELFGYNRGAFTDARKEKPGLFEYARGGTLFLDEIGDLPPACQPKILRALEEKTIRRLGGLEDISVDVRVVAATNRDLGAMVATGAFREDLLYRVNVVTIRMPPLRERRDDILPLADHFLTLFAQEFKAGVKRLTTDAEAALAMHSWPGNVRELRNVIERAVILTPGRDISAAVLALAPRPGGAAGAGAVPLTLEEAERRHIAAVLEAARGARGAAARLLGISRTTLWTKLKQYGLADAVETPPPADPVR
jgi:DNA-binding NtrC family response regulator